MTKVLIAKSKPLKKFSNLMAIIPWLKFRSWSDATDLNMVTVQGRVRQNQVSHPQAEEWN